MLYYLKQKKFSWFNGLDTSTKNQYLEMAPKSVESVIKDYQIHRKDIMKELAGIFY